MNRRFKKMVAVVCAIAMVVTSVTVYKSADVKAAEPDWSTIDWAGDGAEGGALSNTYKFYGENANLVNIQKPGFAKGSSLYVTFPAGISECSLGAENYDIQGAGIALHVNAFTQKVTEFTVTHGNGVSTCYVYNEKGIEGETTTPDPDAPTTTPAPTTTTELQKPGVPGGLVANINDLKTNYVIAFANVATATSYKFYVDDVYKKDITNGGVVTIEELGLEAGKTYTFGVSAVNDAGESDKATISVTVPTTEETTPSESEAPVETTTPSGEAFDPSTITEWTAVTNSTTLSYYIADGKEAKVSVKPEMHGDNLYAAFGLAAAFKSVTLNGTAITPRAGADVEIPKTSFVEGYNKLEVVDFYGNETVTVYIKAEKEAETTTTAYVDGEALVNEANVVKEVPAYEGGDYWQAEYNNMPVNYVTGKKYVAEVVVSSNVDKKIKMVFQRVNIWDFVDAAEGYEAEIKAGNKVKITYVFEATKDTDNGNFDIYLGSVAEAATLTFELKKLTTYNEVPEGVTTGVEVLSAPVDPTYTVTVDGTTAEVVDGKVTLGDAKYGYLYDGKMYAPNTAVEVTTDMAFTSVKELSVTMANGAGIRYAGTAGIRFQATITSDNASVVASDAISEGTLITANDIYEAKGTPLTLTSDYTKLNVVNSGWYNGTVGTYCGSICSVIESNYIRNFTARAYVTINYENADALTIYSAMGPVRSISQIATAVKNDNYKGIAEEYKSTIDSFIK